MRQLSGTMRGGRLELRADPAVDVHATPDMTIAVLHPTAARLSARDLLDSYRKRGLTAVEQREDDCAVLVFDATSRTLVLARDFVGMTPLFFGADDTSFAFGTRVADVLGSLSLAVAPDLDALAGHLVYHTGPSPDATYFEGVSSVPAGHVLVRHGGSLDVRPIDPPVTNVRGWSFDDAAAEFGRLLARAVNLRLSGGGRTAVFVSGGLDSAAIISLAAQATDVVGINYGIADDTAADESRYVAALRRAGLRIEDVPFYPAINVASAEQSVRESEIPVLDMVPLTLARAAAHAKTAGADTILMGIWGDQVLAPFPPRHHTSLVPWRAGQLAHAYRAYMMDVPLPQIRSALRRQALRQHAPDWLLRRRRERQRQRSPFDLLAHRVAHFGPVDRVSNYRTAVQRSVFSTSARQGIETSAKWGIANQVQALLPFLDRELIQFLLTLPDDIAYHRHALKPLLRESMKGVVPPDVLNRRDKGDYTAAMRKRSLDTSTMLDMLDGLRRPVVLGIMSPASARKTLARIEHAADIWDESGELPMLLGLDIWLRLFFEK